MKITVSKTELVRVLNKLVRLASASQGMRGRMPILQTVKIESTGPYVFVTGTDLDIEIKLRLDAAAAEDGVIYMPSRPLLRIAKSLPDKCPVTISNAVAREHRIVGPNFSFVLDALPSADFPVMPDVELWATLPLAPLLTAIGKTAWAASDEESRPVLNATSVEWSGTNLAVCATNGHRLALHESKVDTRGKASFLLPSRVVAAMLELLRGDEVRVLGAEGVIGFEGDGATIIGRAAYPLAYPNYRQVIPKSSPVGVLTFPRDAFEPTTTRLAAFTADSQTMRSRMVLEDGAHPFVDSVIPEFGHYKEDVVAGAYEGESLEIGFNAYYLKRLAQQTRGLELRLEFGGTERPMVVRSPDDPGYTGLLMPLWLLD